MLLPYNNNLKPFSRDLRHNMTDAEKKLWQKIKRKQILGVQFYRQRPIGSFIVDFYANFPKVAIELDGSQHYLPEQIQRDTERDNYLYYLGIFVLRFDNYSVLNNTEGVLEIIYTTVEKIRKT